jgi:hypothetical protein
MKTAPARACSSAQDWFRHVGMGRAVARMRLRQMSPLFRWTARAAVLVAIGLAWAVFAHAQSEAARKYTWKPLEFAILRFNDEAPNSWNIYHCEKKGLLLVRLWKRYLFVDVEEEEVYDLDPQKLTIQGNSVTWSFADLPDKPILTPDWTDRNVGRMQRLRFRLGKDGHVLELQLPFDINGRPIY